MRVVYLPRYSFDADRHNAYIAEYKRANNGLVMLFMMIILLAIAVASIASTWLISAAAFFAIITTGYILIGESVSVNSDAIARNSIASDKARDYRRIIKMEGEDGTMDFVQDFHDWCVANCQSNVFVVHGYQFGQHTLELSFHDEEDELLFRLKFV